MSNNFFFSLISYLMFRVGGIFSSISLSCIFYNQQISFFTKTILTCATTIMFGVESNPIHEPIRVILDGQYWREKEEKGNINSHVLDLDLNK